MKLFALFCLIGSSLFFFGCDDNRKNSFVYDGNTVPGNPIIGTLPNPGGSGGGGGGVCTTTVSFFPESPLTVAIGDAPTIVTVTVSPLGGTFTINNINDGGTGLIVTPGSGENEITIDPSTATATGTATVDATYDASAVDPACTPVNVIYTVNVISITLSFDSGPVDVPIGDGEGEGTPAGNPAVSSIDTSVGSGTTTFITDVRVYVGITHEFRGDLSSTLESPSGVTITLFLAETDQTDVRVILDDDASLFMSSYTSPAVTAASFPAFPSFRPEDPLSTFDNEDANGIWTITVTDNSYGDIGTLNSWGLAFNDDTAIF